MPSADNNPYIVDDVDDDVLYDKPKASGNKHVLDGSPCYCGSTHNMSLPPDVPEEVLEHLQEFLDRLPDKTIDIIVNSENSLALKLLNDFIDFAGEVDKVNHNGPFLRAIAETVDKLGGGNIIGPLVRFYEAEQYIIGTHVLMRTLNNLRESFMADEDADSKRRQSLFDVIDSIMESARVRLQLATERYIAVGEETGNLIDQEIIDNGNYSENASYFASRVVSIPILNLGKDEGKKIDGDSETSEETIQQESEETK